MKISIPLKENIRTILESNLYGDEPKIILESNGQSSPTQQVIAKLKQRANPVQKNQDGQGHYKTAAKFEKRFVDGTYEPTPHKGNSIKDLLRENDRLRKEEIVHQRTPEDIAYSKKLNAQNAQRHYDEQHGKIAPNPERLKAAHARADQYIQSQQPVPQTVPQTKRQLRPLTVVPDRKPNYNMDPKMLAALRAYSQNA